MLQTMLSSLGATSASVPLSEMKSSDAAVPEATPQDAESATRRDSKDGSNRVPEPSTNAPPLMQTPPFATFAPGTNMIPTPHQFKPTRQNYLATGSRGITADDADASEGVGPAPDEAAAFHGVYSKTATAAPLTGGGLSSANISFPTTATTTPIPSLQHIELPPLAETTPPLPVAAAAAQPRPKSGLDQLLEDLPIITPAPQESDVLPPLVPLQTVAGTPARQSIALSGAPLPNNDAIPPAPKPTGRVARYATMPVVLSSDMAFRSPMTLATPSITPHQLIVQKMRTIQQTPQQLPPQQFQRNCTVAAPFIPSVVSSAAPSLCRSTPLSPQSREHAAAALLTSTHTALPAGSTDSTPANPDREPSLEGEEADPTLANNRSGVAVPWYRRRVCCW